MTTLHFIDAKRITRKAISIRNSLEQMRGAGQAMSRPLREETGKHATLNDLLVEILCLRSQLDLHCDQLEQALGRLRTALPEENCLNQGLSNDIPPALLAARAALADTYAISDLLIAMGAVAPAAN